VPRTSLAPMLRHRVEIHTETQTVNALGEYLSAHTLAVEAWADIRPMTQSEQYRAQRLGQETTHRAMIRWRASAPAVGDRIKWGTRWLRIASVVDPDSNRDWLEITATDEGDAVP